jgi:hypothetical protein
MSAHLCKSIYSSWRQARTSSPESTSPGVHAPNMTAYFPVSRTSIDSDRGDNISTASSRRPSSSSSTSTKPSWSDK